MIQGEVHLGKDEFKEALEVYGEACEVYGELKDTEQEVNVLHKIVLAHISKKDKDEALRVAKDAVAVCERAGKGKEEAAAMLMTAVVHLVFEETVEALEVAESVQSTYAELGDVDGETSAWSTIVNAHLMAKNHDAAMEAGEKALELQRQSGNQRGISAALQLIATIYFAKEEPGDALRLANEAHQTALAIEDRNGESAALQMVINAHLAKNEYAEAMTVCHEWRYTEQERKDKVGEAAAAHLESELHRRQDRLDDALKEAKAARRLMRESGNTGLAELQMLQTIVNCNLSKDTKWSGAEALKAAEDGLALVRETGDDLAQGVWLNICAQAHLHKNEPAPAFGKAKEAAEFFRKAEDKGGEGAALHTAATALLAQKGKSYQEAVQCAQDALAIFEETGNASCKASCLNTIASAHLANKDVSQAQDAAREALDAFTECGDDGGVAMAKQLIYDAQNFTDDEAMTSKERDAAAQKAKNAKAASGKFDRQEFAWRDATAEYHYTLLYEPHTGNTQGKRAGTYSSVQMQKAGYGVAPTLVLPPAGEPDGAALLVTPSENAAAYGQNLMATTQVLGALMTASLAELTCVAFNETPKHESYEAATAARMIMQYPCTLALLRSARIEYPKLVIGFCSWDAATWMSDRTQIMASLPDIACAPEETELSYDRGTTFVPTLIQCPMGPTIRRS